MATVVFVDIETAGLEETHPITQIGAAAVRDDQVVDTFERKLTFHVGGADPEALKVNGYDETLWAEEAVPPESAARDLIKWTKPYADTTLISKKGNPYKVAKVAGYNCVSFDLPRIRRLVDPIGWWPACWWYPLDVYQRVIWLFHELNEAPPENFQLQTVLEHFAIDPGKAHDALADVLATVELAKALKTSSPPTVLA